MRPPRPEYLIAEHIASGYTQSYAVMISRNTKIANIGFLYGISNGNDIINDTVYLAKARHLQRVYIAVRPAPVYANEQTFFISFPTQLRRAIEQYESVQAGILPQYFSVSIFALGGHFS